MSNFKREKMANTSKETSRSTIPYMCIYIDASLQDIGNAALECARTNHGRETLIQEIKNMWTTPSNGNPVLPLLSVRTGFDLFLRVMNFPPGSEVIMSAMNIPDMVCIVRHHGLHIVPLDISMDTAAPKVKLLPRLVTPRTVAIVIAHLYGKWSPMDEICAFAKERNLYVVEDCAECFCGFEKLGHPDTHLSLFSFGIIKYYTSFGGAVAKVRPELYGKMVALHDSYSVQSQTVYLTKVLKYALVWCALNSPTCNKTGITLFHKLGYHNYKDRAVALLRGFPDRMIERIRERPSGALLTTMLKRQRSFTPAEFNLQRLKGEYVTSRLPPSLDVVGSKAAINNYWLFPVVTENPDHLMHLLNALGVDAYRGATQLNIVEPLNGSPEPLLPPPPQQQQPQQLLHQQKQPQQQQQPQQLLHQQKQQQQNHAGNPQPNSNMLKEDIGGIHQNGKSNLWERDLRGNQKSKSNQQGSLQPSANGFLFGQGQQESDSNSSSSEQLQLESHLSGSDSSFFNQRRPAFMGSNADHFSASDSVELEPHLSGSGGSFSDQGKPEFNASNTNSSFSNRGLVKFNGSNADDSASDQVELKSHILGSNGSSLDRVPSVNLQYPHEAKYLVDHVLYLPVNKRVPFHVLDRMLRAIHIAVDLDKSHGEEKVKVLVPSKM